MKQPTNEDFDTCAEVLAWLVVWYEKNESDATAAIAVLKAAELEVPESVEDLEQGE